MHLAYLLAQEAAQEERNPILPAANELIWGAVAFAILLFLMYRTVFPQVNKVYKERRENIEGRLEQAEKERDEAEQLLQKYRERLEAAEDKAREIQEQARADAERRSRELLAKADAEAERRLERATEAIRSERDQAIRQLRGEVGTLAVELATRVVGDSLDRDRQLRLVDQYIDQLGDQTQAGALTSRREAGGSGGLMPSPPVDGGSGELKASPPVDGGSSATAERGGDGDAG